MESCGIPMVQALDGDKPDRYDIIQFRVFMDSAYLINLESSVE